MKLPRRPSFVASNNSIRLTRKKLNGVRTVDREPLRRRLNQLDREFTRLAQLNAKVQDGSAAKSVSFDDWELKLQKLVDDCDASIAHVKKRRAAFPKIRYDSELPVVERREEIKKLIRDNQVVIVCGETGSGKSTQLPKICMELGLGACGMIGHTQPRRIAARSIAQRIADELHTPLGQGVGYKIRFTDETSENTFVKLMTDGILLAETQSDRHFDRYEVVIIDEAHERSLNIDFLLGMLKRVLKNRRDLKVIVTSATIDAQRFADYFAGPKGPAPIVEVSGRTYPIEVLYRPIDEVAERRAAASGESGKGASKAREFDDDDAYEATLVDAIHEVARHGRGDILVFMPTARDISETAKLLRNISIPGDDAARKTSVLPLYSRLPAEEQRKIFGKVSHRKIVVATNVAESSLTVPGIRYVIDTGTARISRYSAQSMTQRLPVEPISRASADQRAGRCGRVGPGVCLRLYSQKDYESRPRYTTPEIQRTNLASIILQTKALRLGDVERFPFIDPPRRAAIKDGYKTLFELGAIDEKRRLTKIGQTLSRLPVDPRIGRILLAADAEGALREVLPIAAALEIQDPRERPREKQEAADLKHAQFLDENSDFLSYLKLWYFWQDLKTKTTRSQLRKACRQNFLSFNRMREWSDVYLQLHRTLRSLNMRLNTRRDDYNAIHRAILTGFLFGIAQKSDVSADYLGTSGGKFLLWPGSGVKKKKSASSANGSNSKKSFANKPKLSAAWVVAAERLETSRSFLHTVAKINPAWIEEIGAHLLKRILKEPFWDRETGCVRAYERATLYGLTVVPRRRINFGPLDPKTSRKIFISEALVNREFDCSLPFFEHNGKVEEEAKRIGNKLRLYDFVRAFDAIYDFYDARIPADVYDAVSLKKWHKSASQEERRALFATLADFCAAEDLDEETIKSYPDEFALEGDARLPLEYRFNPGEEDDGVSIVTPVEGLRQLDSGRLGWLVPGLLEQRTIALLKTLPKEIRRELVPVPETAREIVKKLQYGEGSFEETLAREVSRRAGFAVSPDDFDQDRTPLELRFNVRVVDESGKLIAEGRKPEELRKELGVEISRSLETISDPKWVRDGLTTWDFGTLPESVVVRRGGLAVSAYPALCDARFLTSSTDDMPQNEPSKTKGKGGRRASSSPSDSGVALRLFDSRDEALRQTKLGIQRLFELDNRRDLRTQARWLPNAERLRVYASSLPEFEFDSAISELIAACALDLDMLDLPTNEGEYRNVVAAGRKRIGVAVQNLTGWLGRFFESYQEARLAVEKHRNGPARTAASDCAQQLDRLVAPRFYLTTPWRWLQEYPRFFKAIPLRIDKFLNGGARTDAEFTRELDEYWERYEEAHEDAEIAGVFDPDLEEFRWGLEEYRVSLFAQKLGTSIKISSVRLEKMWSKVG